MTQKTLSIDLKATLFALNGNRQLLEELIQMFVEDAPKLIHELEEALENENRDEALRSVHSLRGLVSTFYCKSIMEFAGRLEEHLIRGDFSSLRNGGADQLKNSIHELVCELDKCGLPSNE